MSKVRSMAAVRKEAEEAITEAYDEVVGELKSVVRRSLLDLLGISIQWDRYEVRTSSPLLGEFTSKAQELAGRLLEQPLVLSVKEERMLSKLAREAYLDALHEEVIKLARDKATEEAEAACQRALKDILPGVEADDS